MKNWQKSGQYLDHPSLPSPNHTLYLQVKASGPVSTWDSEHRKQLRRPHKLEGASQFWLSVPTPCKQWWISHLLQTSGCTSWYKPSLAQTFQAALNAKYLYALAKEMTNLSVYESTWQDSPWMSFTWNIRRFGLLMCPHKLARAEGHFDRGCCKGEKVLRFPVSSDS